MLPTVDVFIRFLLLGLTSFGGRAAHIGYFRPTFVEELKCLAFFGLQVLKVNVALLVIALGVAGWVIAMVES